MCEGVFYLYLFFGVCLYNVLLNGLGLVVPGILECILYLGCGLLEILSFLCFVGKLIPVPLGHTVLTHDDLALEKSLLINDDISGMYVSDDPGCGSKLRSLGCDDIAFDVSSDNDAAAFNIALDNTAGTYDKSTLDIHVSRDLAVDTCRTRSGKITVYNGALAKKRAYIQFLIFHYFTPL